MTTEWINRKLPIPQWIELDGDDDSIESMLFSDGDLFLVAVLVHSSRLKKSYWDIHKIVATAYEDDEGVLFRVVAEEDFDVENAPWEYSWGDVGYFMRLN